MASFKKSIRGDDNTQTEQLSHNRVVIEGGGSVLVLVCFFIVLAVASIIFMALAHLELLEALIVATFVSVFVCGWILLVAWTWRLVSASKTAVIVDETLRHHALIEAQVIHATDHYILYKDPSGEYQFRGSTIITENRQFLPREISSSGPQEAILECYDQGMSGRGIEKWLKQNGDKKTSYREISKTLDLYRPGWTTKPVVDADSAVTE